MHRHSLRPRRERIPRPRPEGWGFDMTVCIAALSRQDNVVITVSDMMLSDDWTSHETDAMKLNPIGPKNRWVCLYSGDPTMRHKVIIEHLASCFAENGDDTAEGVSRAVERSFRDTLKAEIEGRALSRFGLDRQAFLERGLEFFGPKEFSRLLGKVEGAELGTDFLVAGWESNGIFRLFSVRDPGVTEHHDQIAYHAIGTGSVQADGYLCGTYYRDLSAPELVYRLCEAKFVSEAAPSVGKRTLVWLLHKDGSHSMFPPEEVEKLRQISQQERFKVPPEAVKIAEVGLGRRHKIPWATG